MTNTPLTNTPRTDDLTTDLVEVSRIRDLNDGFRRSLQGGVLLLTAGVIALGAERQARILDAVARFDSFDPENDPYGEHDCALLSVEGTRILFKVDYYDRALEHLSPDPADPTLTRRVLTIMLAEEY